MDEAFSFWGTPEGDKFHPAECMQELLEKVRRHKVNVDGNVCTVMVTTMVLEVISLSLSLSLSLSPGELKQVDCFLSLLRFFFIFDALLTSCLFYVVVTRRVSMAGLLLCRVGNGNLIRVMM